MNYLDGNAGMLARSAGAGSQYFLIALEVIWFLGRAWLIKWGRDLSRFGLPPAVRGRSWSTGVEQLAVNLTTLAVLRGAGRTGRKCFFRAYILAAILRRRGLPVDFNVGLGTGPGDGRTMRVDGHCWLTLHGRPYLEAGDPQGQFSDFLATGANGIRYWLAPARVQFPSHGEVVA